MAQFPFFRDSTSPKQLLLNVKAELKRIKEDRTSSVATNKNNLKALLEKVSSVLRQENISLNYHVASWLLMADLYGFLSFLWAPSSLIRAEQAFNEAIKCIEHMQQTLITLPDMELDNELIKNCNTFGIADADNAMEIIKNILLPHLKAMSAEQTLINPVLKIK